MAVVCSPERDCVRFPVGQTNSWIVVRSGGILHYFSVLMRGSRDLLKTVPCSLFMLLGRIFIPLASLIMLSMYWWRDCRCSVAESFHVVNILIQIYRNVVVPNITCLLDCLIVSLRLVTNSWIRRALFYTEIFKSRTHSSTVQIPPLDTNAHQFRQPPLLRPQHPEGPWSGQPLISYLAVRSGHFVRGLPSILP